MASISAATDPICDGEFSDEEKAVLDVIDAESVAYFANDFETLADQWLHQPEAIRLFAGPRVGVRQHKGWDQIGEGFRKSMEWAPQHYDAREYLVRENVQISISGDMAWVHYDQVLAKNDPDFITDVLHHETKILHRVGGRWKIACMILVVPERDHTLFEVRPTLAINHTGWRARHAGVDFTQMSGSELARAIAQCLDSAP